MHVDTLPDSDKFLCIAQELPKIYVEEVARSFQHDVVIMSIKKNKQTPEHSVSGGSVY